MHNREVNSITSEQVYFNLRLLTEYNFGSSSSFVTFSDIEGAFIFLNELNLEISTCNESNIFTWSYARILFIYVEPDEKIALYTAREQAVLL